MFPTEFEKCVDEVFRSANKIRAADIQIDEKGDLYFQSNIVREKDVKLTNLIVASNINTNLISLRRFADVGLDIKLDDGKLRIFDKDTGLIFLDGIYEKPNCMITLSVENSTSNGNELQYKNYPCKARIVPSTSSRKNRR